MHNIKAGATGALKSLHQFMGSKHAPFGIRLDTSLPSTDQVSTVINLAKQSKKITYPLISLPLYLIERLEAIVEYYLSNDSL